MIEYNKFQGKDGQYTSTLDNIFIALRFIGGLLGLLIIFIALILSLKVFGIVFDAIRKPDGLSKNIAYWEEIIRGNKNTEFESLLKFPQTLNNIDKQIEEFSKEYALSVKGESENIIASESESLVKTENKKDGDEVKEKENKDAEKKSKGSENVKKNKTDVEIDKKKIYLELLEKQGKILEKTAIISSVAILIEAKLPRWGAIFIIIIFIYILMKFTYMLFRAGAKLLELAGDEKKIMKNLMTEFLKSFKSKPSNASGSGDSSK